MIKDEMDFIDVDEVCDWIFEEIFSVEDLIVSVVAKFDIMKEIVKYIMAIEEGIDFENINLTAPIFNGYEDEYILEVFAEDDGEGMFFNVEPAKAGDKYKNLSNDVVYVFDDCNSKVLDACKDSDVYIVHIGEDDEFEDVVAEEYNCPKCKKNRDLSNVDKTKYRVNGKKVSEKEYSKVKSECDELIKDIRNIHCNFVENKIKDWLKDYCDVMDSFNNLFARMW